MKWLLDWHLVRGTNLILPHACFYSIRGRRAFESEPDLGVHNAWWPHFAHLALYARRLCCLLSDGEHVCSVGILSDGDHLSWVAAKALHQHQVDFIFLDEPALCAASIERGYLHAGSQRLDVVIVDAPGLLGSRAQQRLDEFAAAGGTVLREWVPGDLAERVTSRTGLGIRWDGESPGDVRAMHYRKAGRDFFFVVNEGERAVEGRALLGRRGAVELWDALSGSTRPWPARESGDGLRVPLRLDRRQAAVLAVDPRRPADATHPLPDVPGDTVSRIAGNWQAFDAAGQQVAAPCPGDWAQAPGWETFTGTLQFRAEFDLDGAQANDAAYLDLGSVGDLADVWVNGASLGFRGWAPYLFDLGNACVAGRNRIEVRVTNSMANAYDGLQRPSGLMGPVQVRQARRFSPRL
jgi:hypothetical protein